MLGFLRKHQRYFFVIITIVIVISFSFFGTYSTITSGSGQDPVAFVAVDGTQVTRSELNQLVMFIGTDSEDKLLFGGMWGPNFLNNGVIVKDFFQTGLAELLAGQYPGEIEQDLYARHEKEKRYTLYTHPQAQFLSVVSAWNYLAPDILSHYETLKNIADADSVAGFDERVKLYMAEKKLPASLLRRVLLYQQKQYSWLTPDPNLERVDLSLFGYHTAEDWFGPRFMRLVGEFIINASIIAENKGYQVSRADALADLMQNSEASFKQMLNNPYLGVANSSEYFNEQLQRMRLDKNSAVAIWQKVMLFRRLFHDVGNAVFVDPLMFQKYDQYAMETVEGQLYRLPAEFRFGNFRDMQKFEVYLDAVSKRGEAGKALLALPSQLFKASEVAKNYPELVQKRYLLDVAMVDKNKLQTKVGVKETWNWEVEDQNWGKLQKQFSDLGAKPAKTRDERFAVLDSLDDKMRNKVDEFARKAIVDSHPEWLDKALQESEAQQIVLGLRLKGGNPPFAGLKNNGDLMKLLDRAKLSEQDPDLAKYTADGNSYYRIIVADRAPEQEVLTFEEAQQDETLDDMLDKKLEAYYAQVRDSHKSEFQKGEGSWKPYLEVRNQVATLYFAKTLKAIQGEYTAAVGQAKAPAIFIDDITASLRFYPYFNEVLAKAKKDPAALEPYLQVSQAEPERDKLYPSLPLSDQWKLEKIAYQAERGKGDSEVNIAEAFRMQPNTWSSILTPANGDMHVFYLVKKGNDETAETLADRISKARNLLSDDAQTSLMNHVLKEIKDKKAISLDYLNQGAEMEG